MDLAVRQGLAQRVDGSVAEILVLQDQAPQLIEALEVLQFGFCARWDVDPLEVGELNGPQVLEPAIPASVTSV